MTEQKTSNAKSKSRRRAIAALLYVVLAAVFVSFLARRDAQGFAVQAATPPHVFIVMMENKEQNTIVGSRYAPYINRLAKQYGYAANFYGVTHPSLPNYVASIAGDFNNAFNDWPGNRFNAPNIVDQLEAHHLTWKAYMENLPSPGYNGDEYPRSNAALYARKHDPFMMMTDILRSPRRKLRVVATEHLTADLGRGTVPDLAYIVPNLCHDMHGISGTTSSCPSEDISGLIRTGDAYLSTLIPSIMSSRAWTGNSTILIVWDEGDSLKGCCQSPRGDGGGRVPAIVIARQGSRHYMSRTPYNHYSVLRTLQSVWNLACLANTCKIDVRPMTEFLKPPH